MLEPTLTFVCDRLTNDHQQGFYKELIFTRICYIIYPKLTLYFKIIYLIVLGIVVEIYHVQSSGSYSLFY